MVSDHVLIVDDEASIRQILARWIKAIGYRTIEADCGEAGLAAMVWHDAAVASSAHRSQPADPDAGLQAWLDSLE